MKKQVAHFATQTAKLAGKPAEPIRGKPGLRADQIEAARPKAASPARART